MKFHNAKSSFDTLKAEYEFYNHDLASVLKTNVFKVYSSTTAQNALNIFKLNRVNILPVVDNKNKPIGVLKKNEFMLNLEKIAHRDPINGSKVLDEISVEKFTEYSFIIVPLDYTIGDLMDLFNQTSENFAVVTKDNKFIGVVMESNVNLYLKNNLSKPALVANG